jgi:hypothetical protein
MSSPLAPSGALAAPAQAPAALPLASAQCFGGGGAAFGGGGDADGDDGEDEDAPTKAQWSCDSLRKKITLYLGTKEQTQTAWLREIGVSPPSFASFMKQKGTWKGTGNGTFWGATRFFQRREAAAQAQKKAVPASERKRKSADEAAERAAKKRAGEALLARIAATELEQLDENGSAVVYDDCDDVRRACAAFLAEGLTSQAAFLAALEPRGPPVNGNSLGSFLRGKGAMDGSGNKTYRLAYAFFERRRIAEGRPKSAKRLRSEAEFGPAGRSTQTDWSKGQVWVLCAA